jgi:hypothetical protein
MEMMCKIRRMYFRDKLSLPQIAKRTGLSRNPPPPAVPIFAEWYSY